MAVAAQLEFGRALHKPPRKGRFIRDLTAWLAQIGLEKYAAAFVAHEVDLASLPYLTDNDLKPEAPL